MRQTCIFSGSSHPQLVEAICDRLGSKPSKVDLKKFANGETSVEIKTSVRDQDVFIVQSGSSQINDNVMELLIMISACKGGSAKSITAVMPYFPYSRQSKKKTHRGAITARMVANLMHVAGVNHVITIDLHASQMQGFFKCPVDNLMAEPLLAKWVRMNVPDWWEAVVVSKNPGGTKRVTSLADALKLNFGIMTTDRRRPYSNHSMFNSVVFESIGTDGTNDRVSLEKDAEEADASIRMDQTGPRKLPGSAEHDFAPHHTAALGRPRANAPHSEQPRRPSKHRASTSGVGVLARSRMVNGNMDSASSPLSRSTRLDSIGTEASVHSDGIDELALQRHTSVPGIEQALPQDHHHYPNEDGYEEPANSDDESDGPVRDVITGRLIHGHIVDDNAPSPSMSVRSGSVQGHSGARGSRSSDEDQLPDAMTQSFTSAASMHATVAPSSNALGGTGDATHSDEEEEEALKDPGIEHTVTLVGNVKDKTVLIVDDMIDKAASWIAAAETVVKRGGATRVYCMASHGLFGGDCLQELDACEEIEAIVVTDSFPVPEEKRTSSKKLVILDVSGLLSEAIRRNHHGESISQLYQYYD